VKPAPNGRFCLIGCTFKALATQAIKDRGRGAPGRDSKGRNHVLILRA